MTSSGAERPAIAVIKRGSFSSANQAFLSALAEQLPEYDFDVIDVIGLLAGEGRRFEAFSRLAALREFPRLLLLRREKMHGAGGCLIRTSFYLQRLRRLLLERLSERQYVFTLQTQSLFDGSLPGTPHFVYTDSAELECLALPGFPPKNLFSPRWIAAETSIYRNASMVFAMSQKTRRCLVAEYGLPESQVAWVRAGTNAAPKDGDDRSPDHYRSKRILFVGVRWKHKGGPELAAAFERVLESHPDAKLTIVGSSPALELPNCEVLGRVPLDQVAHYYDLASIFCLPTWRDAYSFAVVEALAHGLPVVSTRTGAIPEHVVDGENGYLVEAGDVDALADRLGTLLGDPERCRRFGLASRAKARGYSWKTTAEAVLRHIETVVGPL
jgi:glycosyltransferase involved in cell wall biosynthesis